MLDPFGRRDPERLRNAKPLSESDLTPAASYDLTQSLVYSSASSGFMSYRRNMHHARRATRRRLGCHAG